LVAHPRVSVNAKERRSKPITVVGAVGHAMVYQMDGPVTLLEVLAQAGGIANDDGDSIIITRPAQPSPHEQASTDSAEPPESGPEAPPPAKVAGLSKPDGSPSATPSAAPAHAPNAITINLNELVENGDATNNIQMQAGDIVTVPHAGIVYVLGA